MLDINFIMLECRGYVFPRKCISHWVIAYYVTESESPGSLRLLWGIKLDLPSS